MAEVRDDEGRVDLYRKLLNDPATRTATAKLSYKQWESKLLNDDNVLQKVADYATKKNWALDQDEFLYKYAPEKAARAPKQQAAPKQEFLEVPSLEEQEAYIPPPQPAVGSLEYDKQLQAQYGGMSPTLGATFAGAPASFETEEQKKQEQISPVFKAQKLAFEDVPIAEEQRESQRQFAKATKEQQQAALRGGAGFELEQEKRRKERGYGEAASDLAGTIAAGGKRIGDSIVSTLSNYVNGTLRAGLPDIEATDSIEELANYELYNNATKAQNAFQDEVAKRNIQTSVLQAIEKGEYGKIPEATLYTIGDAAMQIIPAILTMGGSTYFQTLPQAYKDGVDAIAKEEGLSPEQVIASGKDAKVVAQISSGIQSGLEFAGANLVSSSIASRGGYKVMRDWLLGQGVNRNLARGASLLGVGIGEGVTEYLQEGTGQIGTTAAKSPTTKAFFENLPKELFTPEAKKQRREAFVGGLVGGMGVGGAGQTFQSAMDRTLFEAPKIGKATQRPDMDVVQLDNKIQERNKIVKAMEEAVRANPEAEGQIRQQYQKRINEAAPADNEVLMAYESLALLPETEEKNAIRENLEAYMAEKGIAPQAEAVTAEEVQGTGRRIVVDSIEEVPAEYRDKVFEVTAGPLGRFGIGKKQYAYIVPTETVDVTAPEITTEEDLAEDIPFEDLTDEEAIVEETSQEDEDLASLVQDIDSIEQDPAEEEVLTEETVTIAPLNIDFAQNEGRNVNYQGIEGRIKIDSDGAPYVFTKDGDVIYIEGGLSGQTPQQLGVQPLADDVINEADIETVLEDETAPLDQNELQYDFDNNTITLYGKPFTYEGVETNSKGQTTALRLRDANGKVKFVRNEDTILEFEIQKELYEKSRTNKQPTIESATAAAEQLQVVPITRVEQVSEPIQQEGSTSNLEGDEVAAPTTPAPKGRKKAAPVKPAPAAPKKEEAPKPEPKKEESPKPTSKQERIKELEQEKSTLTTKALKQFPNSPVQLKTRKRIDEINAELDQLKGTEKVQPKKEQPTSEEKPSSTTPQEGDTVEIAPQREGGSPRKMVFKGGEWKQNVGGEITIVGASVQQQAQEAFAGKAEVKPAETKQGKKDEAKEEKVTPTPKKGVFTDLTEIGGIKFDKNGVAKTVPIKGKIEKIERAMGMDGIFKIYTLSTQYGVPIEVFGDIDNFVDGKPTEGSEVSFTANVRNLDYRLRVIGPKTEYKQPKPATTTKEEKPAPAAQLAPPQGEGATILPSVDADKAEAQLYIQQSNNYYTLWWKRKEVDNKTGKNLWVYSTYLTILSQNIDDAREKALAYLNRIASGESLSEAFVGKNIQDLRGAKTIALQEGVLTPETQPIYKSKTPGVEKNFGIGKYSGLTIDELLDKDLDYALWFVNNYTSRGADQTKAIIKGDPRYQNYLDLKKDIEELERARIEAYEQRESERKLGKSVPIKTLIRGEEGEIKEVVEETEAKKKQIQKQKRRLVKDQITDIIPPQAKVPDKVDLALKPQMFTAQIDGANTAIASMDKYGVLLNGDGAGVGKTRQIVAVAKYYADKGKPVVIISENAALGKPFEGGKTPTLGGSMAKDSEAMGVSLTLLTDKEKVKPGGIYVSTYNRVQDADVPDGAIVIFDESHNLVNTFGRTPGGEEIEEERQWEAKFRPMLKKAEAVAYYSATPADKPHQLAYLYKVLGFNSPEEFLSQMMENGAVIKERKFGRTKIKYYDVPTNRIRKEKLYGWVNGLMVKAGEEGRFIKREISYEGTDVQFHDVKGIDENKNPYAKEFNEVVDAMSAAQGMDYRLLAPNSYILYAAELSKIGEAVNIVKKQLAQGRKSIIFVSRINPMEIRGRKEGFGGELGSPEVLGEIPSPVPMLEEALRKEGISFVGLHSKAKTTSQKAQKQFAEEADVLIASLESGGTGINLDDTVGDNPRTEVFLFSPYRGISTIQGMGRIWRASTIQDDNNPNRYVFVTTSDISPDLKRSGVLAKKLQLMNAAIGGTAVSKLPMSKVSYSTEELVGIELPDDTDEESAIFKEKTGILKPVQIKWNSSRKGGYYADATADLLEWMERGGPDRTGLDVRVFKSEEGKWVALAGKDYKAEEFAPENISNEASPSFTSQKSSNLAAQVEDMRSLPPAKRKAAQQALEEQYGKEEVAKMIEITANFTKIIDDLEQKQEVKKDCP
jgi:hypothetical protein